MTTMKAQDKSRCEKEELWAEAVVDLFQFISLQRRLKQREKMSEMTFSVNLPNATALYRRKC